MICMDEIKDIQKHNLSQQSSQTFYDPEIPTPLSYNIKSSMVGLMIKACVLFIDFQSLNNGVKNYFSLIYQVNIKNAFKIISQKRILNRNQCKLIQKNLLMVEKTSSWNITNYIFTILSVYQHHVLPISLTYIIL